MASYAFFFSSSACILARANLHQTSGSESYAGHDLLHFSAPQKTCSVPDIFITPYYTGNRKSGSSVQGLAAI